MVVLVSVETVLLVLLVVLVAGLLRSHAELLRRLESSPDGSTLEPGLPSPPSGMRDRAAVAAAPLTGVDPLGDPVALAFDGAGAAPTLLAFLTSGCSTCAGFWETLGERRVPGVQTVIVTRGAERERPARLRSLTPDGVAVVMSSQAWEDYRVPGAPYFVLVDGEIRGEGVATGWPALSSLIRDAIEDAHEGERPDAPSGPARARRIEDTLAAGGIHAEHPSLYPSRSPAP